MLHISLPSLHGYDVKMPCFTFNGGREQATTKFCSPFFVRNMVLRNSTAGEFANISQGK